VDLRYELRRLAKELGLTTIHVTHDQEEAQSVSDRIVLMRAGTVVETGTPEELTPAPGRSSPPTSSAKRTCWRAGCWRSGTAYRWWS